MKTLTSFRSHQFTESVIREMTRQAILHDAVNLAQGFPDSAPPSAMLEAAIQAIRSGLNQYAITWGTKNLREAIAKKFAWYQGIQVDPESEITVTCGSTEAMIASLLAIINPGEEVIIFEPFYENYGPDTILSNATPKYVTLHRPSSSSRGTWWFDFEELQAAFNEKTKAIIINTPNNPTGKVFTQEELTWIADLCRKWNAVAITDEIYEHIYYEVSEGSGSSLTGPERASNTAPKAHYEETHHISIATLPGMRERTITINAVSKTYSATGWRVGWAIAAPPLTQSIRKVHDFLTVGAPHPLQEGAAAALNLDRSYHEAIAEDYRKRRDFLLQTLLETGFQCWKPFGAYYIMTDFSKVLVPREIQNQVKNDVDFANWLVKEIGVAGVPGSSFYRDTKLGASQMRFSFGRKMEVLKEAEKKLKKLPHLTTVK